MTLSNYTIGAKLEAKEAGTVARPDQDIDILHIIRPGKIVEQTGNTFSVQILDDTGEPLKDINEVELPPITRVAKFPPDADETTCVLCYTASGLPFIINTANSNGDMYQSVWEMFAALQTE